MAGWALKIQLCHLDKSTTKPPMGSFILSAARLAVGFGNMKAILTIHPSDQIFPPYWGSSTGAAEHSGVNWCPKKCTASVGLGGWCWADTSMSSQRSQRTQCGTRISCLQWELLDCSWADTGRADKKHIQVRPGEMHHALHKYYILQKR